MDATLLDAWRAFVRAPSPARASDFYTVFMGPLTAEDVARVFDGVEQGDRLAPRLARIKRVGDRPDRIDGPERRDKVEVLVGRWLRERQRQLIAEGRTELARRLDGLALRWTDQDGFIDAKTGPGAWMHGEVLTLLGDRFREALGDYSLVVSALMEATYGATRDYDLVWYLLAPLMDIEIDSEPVIALRENGIGVVLTESEIVLVDWNA